MRLNPIALIAALSIAFLTACATPLPATPPPVTGSPPPRLALPPASEDTCRAASYASYVGQDHRQVPRAPAGRAFRVVCTTCAMTKDLSLERLNFFYDASSGRVVRLSCG